MNCAFPDEVSCCIYPFIHLLFVDLSSHHLCHPFIYPSIHFSIYSSITLSIHPFLYLSIHFSIYSSISLSIHPLLYLFIHFFIYPSISLSIHPFLYLFIHFSIYPFISLFFQSVREELLEEQESENILGLASLIDSSDNKTLALSHVGKNQDGS